jgi:hypothetical protein
LKGAAAMLLGIWLLSLLQARRTKPSPTGKQFTSRGAAGIATRMCDNAPDT